MPGARRVRGRQQAGAGAEVEHMVAGDGDDGKIDGFGEVIEARIDSGFDRGCHVRIDDENIARIAKVLEGRQHTDRAGDGNAG